MILNSAGLHNFVNLECSSPKNEGMQLIKSSKYACKSWKIISLSIIEIDSNLTGISGSTIWLQRCQCHKYQYLNHSAEPDGHHEIFQNFRNLRELRIYKLIPINYHEIICFHQHLKCFFCKCFILKAPKWRSDKYAQHTALNGSFLLDIIFAPSIHVIYFGIPQ